MPNPSGYSKTPLAKKLGIVTGTRVLARHAPPDYEPLLRPLPAGVTFEDRLSASTDIVHLFVTREAQLEKDLAFIRSRLRADAVVWVSWPKQAAKQPTDVTENVIRAIALPMGLVDVKVCAVSEIWSGLKLVVRKELR